MGDVPKFEEGMTISSMNLRNGREFGRFGIIKKLRKNGSWTIDVVFHARMWNDRRQCYVLVPDYDTVCGSRVMSPEGITDDLLWKPYDVRWYVIDPRQ